jgi:hypothetical protein
MGQCRQTTLVTVTYPVINNILRTLAYTLGLDKMAYLIYDVRGKFLYVVSVMLIG